MAFGLEVRRGLAELLTTTVEVSGTREGGVWSSVFTTFEMDGCVVGFAGVVPFRPGDEVVVAGHRQPTGVLRAYAVRLPRQGVLLGGFHLADLVSAALMLLIGCVVLLFGAPAAYVDISRGGMPTAAVVVPAICAIIGVVLAGIGAAGMWSSTVAGEAGMLVMDVGTLSRRLK